MEIRTSFIVAVRNRLAACISRQLTDSGKKEYLFSPKPSSIPEQKYLVLIDRFFAIVKSHNHFKMIQLIIAN